MSYIIERTMAEICHLTAELKAIEEMDKGNRVFPHDRYREVKNRIRYKMYLIGKIQRAKGIKG